MSNHPETIKLDQNAALALRAHAQAGARILAICEQLFALDVALPGALKNALQQRAQAEAAITASAKKSALKAGVDVDDPAEDGAWRVDLAAGVIRRHAKQLDGTADTAAEGTKP